MTNKTDQEPIAPNAPVMQEQEDVQEIHAPLIREQLEPRDGFEPIPFWMALVFGGLVAWGGYYVGQNSADYRADVYDRPNPKVGVLLNKPEEIPTDMAGLMRLGQRVYNNCVGCHQTTGEGNPSGGIPPLNKSEWVVGDQASAARLSRILLYGLNGDMTVRGQTYRGAQMPAWGGPLKDYQIAAVLTYIRNSWDNKADIILPADVEAARKKEAGRSVSGSDPMTELKLRAIPLDQKDTASSTTPMKK